MAKYGKVASDRREARSQSALSILGLGVLFVSELQKIETGVGGGGGGFYLGQEQLDSNTL